MVTIRRHPVPADSYDPDRPLNDLLLAQFEHFKHVAQRLPPEVRSTIPAEPSTNDREGVDRFIAAITGAFVSKKIERPQLVKVTRRRKQPVTLAIAASAEEKPKRSKPAQSKSKSKRSRDARRKQ